MQLDRKKKYATECGDGKLHDFCKASEILDFVRDRGSGTIRLKVVDFPEFEAHARDHRNAEEILFQWIMS